MKTEQRIVSAGALIAVISVAACGNASGAGTGRIAGDPGKHRPAFSCWIDTGISSGGDETVTSITNLKGSNTNKAQCRAIVAYLKKELPSGYMASITTPDSPEQMKQDTVCSGFFGFFGAGYRVTSAYYGTLTSMGGGSVTCGALRQTYGS
jgi:hypothetical protein